MSDDFNVLIGKQLLRRRRQLGLTQSQLAARIGVRFQQIHKYESGACNLTAERLWQLSKALSVDVSFFFEELDDRAYPDGSSRLGMS